MQAKQNLLIRGFEFGWLGVARYAYQSLWYAYPYHSYPYSYQYVARKAWWGGRQRQANNPVWRPTAKRLQRDAKYGLPRGRRPRGRLFLEEEGDDGAGLATQQACPGAGHEQCMHALEWEYGHARVAHIQLLHGS
eukprot:1157799-Pelagomonas_calceolata.AAC.4